MSGRSHRLQRRPTIPRRREVLAVVSSSTSRAWTRPRATHAATLASAASNGTRRPSPCAARSWNPASRIESLRPGSVLTTGSTSAPRRRRHFRRHRRRTHRARQTTLRTRRTTRTHPLDTPPCRPPGAGAGPPTAASRGASTACSAVAGSLPSAASRTNAPALRPPTGCAPTAGCRRRRPRSRRRRRRPCLHRRRSTAARPSRPA